MAYDRITPTRLGGSELAISPSVTTLRTTPIGVRDLVKRMDLANNNAGTAIINVWFVPSGDSPSSNNLILPGVSLATHALFQWTGTQVLHEGATIQANSNATGVCLTISGGEVS